MSNGKINLFHAIILNRAFLLFPLFVITFVAVSVTFEEINFLSKHFDDEAVKFIQKNEETLAILLIGFGVVMEGRENFSKKVLKLLDNETFSEQHELNEICEYYGFILLVVGLFIEIIDQIALYLHEYHTLVLILEAGVNLSLNFISIWFMMVAAYRIFKVEKTEYQI